MELNKIVPFIPVNVDNEEYLEKLITERLYKENETVSPDSIEVDLGALLLSPLYFVLWSIKARYKFIGGSKDNGKSFQGAMRVVTKWLTNPNRHVVVLRRHANLNAGSTLKDVIKVMNILADTTGIDQFRPVSAEDYRSGGKKEIFVYTKTSPIQMENKVTRQIIHFTGLDRLAQGGFSLENPKHAIDTIWADEMVDITNDIGADLMDDSTFSKWLTAESTVFRGTYDSKLSDDGNTVVNFRKKGLEWVDEEVIFTFNAHNPSHWQVKDYLDKYVPLDPLNIDDCLEMRKTRTRTYYDPDYMNGQGLYVSRVSAYINEDRNRDRIEQLRKDNFTEWAYLYLGATKSIGGLAYTGLEGNIRIENIDKSLVVPISIGIDHANSPTHKDLFAVSFLATSFDTGLYGEGYTGYSFASYQFKYFYDEMGWSNMTMDFRSDEQLAEMVIERLIKHVDGRTQWERQIAFHGLSIVIDLSAGSFMQTMIRVLKFFIDTSPHLPWLRSIRVIACEGKNKQMMINGTKQNARYGRVERNKAELENYMIVFNPNCYHHIEQFNKTAYGTKKTQYGQEEIFVIDKDRDFVDCMDYSVMAEPHNQRFNQMLMLKENKRKKSLYN